MPQVDIHGYSLLGKFSLANRRYKLSFVSKWCPTVQAGEYLSPARVLDENPPHFYIDYSRTQKV